MFFAWVVDTNRSLICPQLPMGGTSSSAATVEVCSYCDERHSRDIKCSHELRSESSLFLLHPLDTNLGSLPFVYSFTPVPRLIWVRSCQLTSIGVPVFNLFSTVLHPYLVNMHCCSVQPGLIGSYLWSSGVCLFSRQAYCFWIPTDLNFQQ